MPTAGIELCGKWTFNAALDADARAYAAKAHLNPVRKRLAGAPARKVGRNDPCPCGSGLKYKKCCLP
ncbi:SEC-C metal-binding domain-containing protein [Novacetimonas hansenii]